MRGGRRAVSRGGALAQVKALATETAGAFRDLLKLNHRMGRIQARTRVRAPCAPAGVGLRRAASAAGCGAGSAHAAAGSAHAAAGLSWGARAQASEDALMLGELEAMRPRDLSFWIGSVFADNSKHQQSLLQARRPAAAAAAGRRPASAAAARGVWRHKRSARLWRRCRAPAHAMRSTLQGLHPCREPCAQTPSLLAASLRPERAPQEDSTLERLRQEHDVLTGTVSYLRAKLALEGAFNADAEGGGGEGGGSSGGEAT